MVVEFIQKNRTLVLAALAALVLGFLLGLLYAYVLSPVVYVDTTPEIMRHDLQVDYMRMAIDSYQVNRDVNLAVARWTNLGLDQAPQILLEIQQNLQGQNPEAVLAYGRDVQAVLGMVALPESPAGEEETPQEGIPVGRYLLIFVAVVLVLAVVGAVAYFFMRTMRGRSSDTVTPAMQAQEFTRQASRTDYGSLGLAEPITRTMTTYVLGDNLYDESFSIDSPAGEFLGEYGVGVSETIGVGDPKRVTALEVWLFDKNDIKTATKVLMSAHAYNDLAVRQRLEAKGELVLVEPQQQVLLETATLQMLVTVTDLEYGQGPLPPSSYFERITLELGIWPRQG